MLVYIHAHCMSGICTAVWNAIWSMSIGFLVPRGSLHKQPATGGGENRRNGNDNYIFTTLPLVSVTWYLTLDNTIMFQIGRCTSAFRRTAFSRINSGLRRTVATEAEAKAASQIERIEARLPKFLRRFTRPLRTAPISHITAFLILHELTAIVPLFGLAAFFHYTNWLPPYISEGRWVQEGTERFGKWLRKRGYIDAQDDRRSKWFGRSEGGVRIAVELATAYAITKVLLPLRLPMSIWLTPWFARWTVLPARNRVRRAWTAKSKPSSQVTAPSTAPSPPAVSSQPAAKSQP